MAANVLWRTIALVAVTAVAAAIMGAGQPQALPEYPNVFSGSVTIAGEPAPDGVEIFARVGSSYQSNVARPGFEAHERPVVLTAGGRYDNLKVQPTGTNNIGRSITFFATYGNGEVEAAETLNFQPGPFFENNHDLTFAALPPGAAEPTPVSTTEATTPTPAEPTPPPSPSPTPVLPIPGDPNIPRISQLVLVLGAAAIIAGGAMLMLIRRRKVL